MKRTCHVLLFSCLLANAFFLGGCASSSGAKSQPVVEVYPLPDTRVKPEGEL